MTAVKATVRRWRYSLLWAGLVSVVSLVLYVSTLKGTP